MTLDQSVALTLHALNDRTREIRGRSMTGNVQNFALDSQTAVIANLEH